MKKTENKKSISIEGKLLVYTLRKNRRSKRIKLSVGRDASVCLTIPWRANEELGHDFILKKAAWVLEKINYFKNTRNCLIPEPNVEDYQKYKKLAIQIVEQKIEILNSFYKFKFQKVSVRKQKTRWGSCSKNGNLSFNYRLIFLPEKISDYIIIHELCHLEEFNHGKNFWALVAKLEPNYKEIRKQVRLM